MKNSKTENEKRFVGIELGPGITSSIQRKVRIQDWNQEEIDAYYEVLAFAKKTPYDAQKSQAEKNLADDMKKYRDELQAEYEKRIKRYRKLAEKHPEKKRGYARLQAAAARRLKAQLKKLDEFKEKPEKYPLFARLTKSMVEDSPSPYHGKLVTLSGQVRKLISYPAHENKFGIKRLYEAWMFTSDAGMLRSRNEKSDAEGAGKNRSLGKVPVVIIFTEKPAGMPEGERILEAATVTGYVFRVHKYADFRNTQTIAPMILAKKLEWHPRQKSTPTPRWVFVAELMGLLAIILAIWWVAQRDQRIRTERREHSLDESTPFFSD
ncbi:MAG: hypothetical protein Tsb009_31400 [Planctomycetaceae bacterium]